MLDDLLRFVCWFNFAAAVVFLIVSVYLMIDDERHNKP